ncbi:MAG TPA: adenylate/guanylate cyclase domain-containing protein [Alphaproteobacteria bacterium]|nr:adenylate/guanylate cyclase domain-containing protein [Alphaproteobacteria bacterium]
MPRTVTERWTWHFDSPPEAVWAVLADTARFNEAAGFPKHRIETVAEADGTIVYIGTARQGPLTVRWRDLPVQWVANERFVHCRAFIGTPLKRLCATLQLTPEGGGTRADYTLGIEPRNLLGRLAAWRVIAGARESYVGLIESARAYLAGRKPAAFDAHPPVPGAEVRARIDSAVAAIERSPHGNALARRLADYVISAPEVDVQHLRPLRLAALWRAGERETVELCLEAVKAGLLGMDWTILCPRCRGAKTTATTLEALPDSGHCDSCNVAYGRDFARNVELEFHPAPAIRTVAGGEFCLFGPMSVPHVKLQQTLAPGETRRVALALPPGDYRLRPLNTAGQVDVSWDGRGGFPSAVLGDGTVEAGPASAPGEIVLVNRGRRAQTAVVEDLHWQRDALTAHRVTAMQAFRDLFEAEVLRPGDEVAIERIALMFTDLRGSTALYTRIGDARAYQLVRQHFVYLAGKVRQHNGTIVKTIGDAVMAAFADPGDAMRAALDVQRSVAAFNAAQRHGDIVIKLGLHEGPTIAVTLNGRLDYFGTTVNMAARLQGQSVGGDVVLSQNFGADPAVAPLLAGLALGRETARFKGFDAPVGFLRIDAAALVVARSDAAVQPARASQVS